MVWKLASKVYAGGSEEAKALTGKKVRITKEITEDTNRTKQGDGKASFIRFKTGLIGLIAGVPTEKPHLISIGLPNDATVPTTISKLLNSPHHFIWISWGDFRSSFEIDA